MLRSHAAGYPPEWMSATFYEERLGESTIPLDECNGNQLRCLRACGGVKDVRRCCCVHVVRMPFACPECGRSFASPLERRKHSNEAHPSEERAKKDSHPEPRRLALRLDSTRTNTRLQVTLENGDRSRAVTHTEGAAGLRGGGSTVYPQLTALLEERQRRCDECPFIKRRGMRCYMDGNLMEEVNAAVTALNLVNTIKLHFLYRWNVTLGESARCQEFAAAVRCAVEEGCSSFLCIGIGNMISALVAAQLGASVTVCEPTAFLRELASAIAHENGLDINVITNIPQNSASKFEGCICEDMEPTIGTLCHQMATADENCLVAGASMIPQCAAVSWVRVVQRTVLSYPVQMRACGVQLDTGVQCGVDLAEFDRFRFGSHPERHPGYHPIFLNRQQHTGTLNRFLYSIFTVTVFARSSVDTGIRAHLISSAWEAAAAPRAWICPERCIRGVESGVMLLISAHLREP